MKKRFSLRYKLILIFGLVVACGSLIEGLLAVRIARNAILEKIEVDLIDKADDTAEIINGRATSFLQFIEGIARMPILRDSGVALKEKLDFLEQEVAFNTRKCILSIAMGTVFFVMVRRIQFWIVTGSVQP